MKIDNEFMSLIRPLSGDEYEKLEANILAEGIRDPLVTIAILSKEQCDEITSYNTKKYIGSMKI